MIKAKEKKKNSPAVKIPEKLFYKIGEVGRITGVEPYVLRYWESEFPFLKPRKSRSGQRLYVKKDIETILEIKRLLYEERYTIEGVKRCFSESNLKVVPSKEPDVQAGGSLKDKLEHIKTRLREIINQL
ncbi:MAG: MerR family transcriptional regulator [Nitrospirae bacterium]|nr:MAG: MerR family transcriptional regulator [Nitrospirota bacterium]